MFIVDEETLEITVSKGDGGTLDITFEGDVPPDGTIALVTLKRQPRAINCLWEKRIPVVDGKITVHFASGETDYIPAEYKWDIRLIYNDNSEPYTPLVPTTFNIIEVVGDV